MIDSSVLICTALGWMVGAVDFLRAEHEVGEGQREQRFDFGDGPVVAYRSVMPIPLSVDLHQFSGWPSRAARRRNSRHVREPRIHCQPVAPAVRLTVARRLVAAAGRHAVSAALLPVRLSEARRSISICARFCRADCPGTTSTRRRRRGVALRAAGRRADPPAQVPAASLPNARVLGVLLAQAVRRARRAAAAPARARAAACRAPARTRLQPGRGARALRRPHARAFRSRRGAVRRVRDTPSQTSLERGRAASQRARRIRRERRARAAQVVSGGSRGHRRRRHDHRQHRARSSAACCSPRASGRWKCGRWRRRRLQRPRAGDQARPAFFSASSGGPSNFSSGTLPT